MGGEIGSRNGWFGTARGLIVFGLIAAFSQVFTERCRVVEQVGILVDEEPEKTLQFNKHLAKLTMVLTVVFPHPIVALALLERS